MTAHPAPPPARDGRLGVGVVGAGRVGAVLGSALRAAGHAVVGASGVSEDSRERIEQLLPGVPRLDVPEVVRRAELVLLAVPDDALPDLVAGLAATGAWQAGQLVVHTAGRFGTGVLAPAAAAGAIGLAVHPAMTFTGTSVDLARLVGSSMAVTAPPVVLPVAQALVIEMGAEPVVVPEAARAAYHAGLAHAANHLVTVLAQARQVLAEAGVEAPAALLGPLARAALDEALRAGDLALTGPVARGDAGTLAEHVAALAAVDARRPDGEAVLPAYRALSRATVLRALAQRRLAPAAADALLGALDERPPGSADADPRGRG
ncbi:Rossmann-like and DUF2520 domain-containing protein [Aquipuribacter nitratireducens]|uniref:Rossmann-like and DUF2520 domain-containing protein n=1 Tax=Aquipuribacter nitratireducens TaxID=650104 RepID=A0ABW0GSQ3_9MICO